MDTLLLRRQVLMDLHHWHDEDCNETYCLRIELVNDVTIKLTINAQGASSVKLEYRDGELEFERTSIAGFREVVAAIDRSGKIPDADLLELERMRAAVRAAWLKPTE